ncbi:transposon Ty3-I Gag-Pol polyprotein [Trichonephila clavipes]|nr:transposon Ty3-I Gag-Pol polyprotein [Trichonephila clavipes]
MGCQLLKPEKIGDRAPITPIVRPELPFEIVNIDVIGPIQPSSGRGHKYVLCMMDQHTRWPEANLRKGLDLSPRFSCPGYPASNGLVERWNKVLKDMIHHVIREDPREAGINNYLFCCLHTVKYRTLPLVYHHLELLYGREARGPLAILKSSRAGEIHLPTNISQSVAA